jgi:hypothetical protein
MSTGMIHGMERAAWVIILPRFLPRDTLFGCCQSDTRESHHDEAGSVSSALIVRFRSDVPEETDL